VKKKGGMFVVDLAGKIREWSWTFASKMTGHGLVTENPLKMGKLSMFILLPNVFVCISFFPT